MGFMSEYTYDSERRIWSGVPDTENYASDQSIGEIIFQEMKRHPKLTAQISATENTVLTREELLLNSMRAASYLRKLGMVQSDIVGIIARNTTHMSAVAYGCFFNGIAFHALNINHDKSTIEKLFDITKPRLIFCDGDEYEKVKSATANMNVMIVTMRNHPKDSISIEEVLATPVDPDFKPYRLEKGSDQTLAILCSSGTTGTPKAVTITNSRKIFSTCTSLTTEDVQFTHSTLDWVTGLTTMVTSAAFSTTRIIVDQPFDPVHTLQTIERYKATWLLQAPSHMAMIANCKELDQTNLHSVRYYFYGGGRCSIEVQKRIRKRLLSDCLHMVYAFTEGGAIAFNFNFDEKPNSVGRLLKGIKLKIIGNQGENLGPIEVGEIFVHNGQYWGGYYGNPEETLKIQDSNLWFRTGDLGYMDDDGFLYIMDRAKDMLKYQGLMYVPSDIEKVITEMPDVAEVCVFGIWNEINGDEAAAAVVKKVGSDLKAQDVIDYVQDHIEAKYKQLHGGVIIVDDLMRTGNGKINRVATKSFFVNIKNGK